MADPARILHEDGTACDHEGAPSMGGPHGPALCPGGVRVTHVQVAGGQTVELGAAMSACTELGRVFAAAVTPLIAAALEFGRQLTQDPAFQATAAAARAWQEAEDAQRKSAESPPEPQAGGGGGLRWAGWKSPGSQRADVSPLPDPPMQDLPGPGRELLPGEQPLF